MKNQMFSNISNEPSQAKQVKPIHFSPEETILVIVNEYSETNKNSKQPVLGSHSATTCVILAVYNKETTHTMLAHITTTTLLSDVERRLAPFIGRDCVAYLVGKESETYLYQQMIELLKRAYMCFEVMLYDGPASLAIDARTGEVISPIDRCHLATREDASDKMLKDLMNIKASGHIPLNCYEAQMSSELTAIPKPQPNTLFTKKKSHDSVSAFSGFKSGFMLNK